MTATMDEFSNFTPMARKKDAIEPMFNDFILGMTPGLEPARLKLSLPELEPRELPAPGSVCVS